MEEKIGVICPTTPQAIGPYQTAVKVGNMIFISGQIPIHPQSGEVVGANVAQQTELVLRYLTAILGQVEAGLGNVVKTTVYMTDISKFDEMNAVYAKHFDFNPPARATVEVSRLPKGVMIEIDAIAMIKREETHGLRVGM